MSIPERGTPEFYEKNQAALREYFEGLSPEKQAVVAAAGGDEYDGLAALFTHQATTPEGLAYGIRVSQLIESNRGLLDSLGDN